MISVLKLDGGIGNQLFQYFQAVQASLLTETDLTLDFRDVYLGKTNHKSTISSLRLPVECKQINQYPSKTEIVIGKLLKAIGNKMNFKKNITEQQQGIDCQNSKYYESVLKKFPDWTPSLLKSSSWYQRMNSLAEQTNFIAIHIRRGDYAHPRNSETIGLLSISYYLQGIDLVQSRLGDLPVWLFSDEPEYVLEIMPLMPRNCRLILSPNESDPAETLLIMSKAKGFVLSNSTFSWWGARFARDDSFKVVPSPWFRNLQQPNSLKPESWEDLESIWENETR